MQSKIGFLALTLANLVVAGPCKPSRPTSVSLATSVTTADISDHSTDVLNSQTTTDTLSVEFSTTTGGNKDSTDVSSSRTIVDSDSVTTSGPTSDITNPTLTVPQSSTTTEEEVIITTLSNSLAGGSFASRDPDSPSGLKDFGATGNAEFHSGGCYKGDGSPDDGCAALTAGGSPDGKRSFFGRFASIYQVIKAAPRKKYTIQFLYLVTSTGGSQDCVVSATFGNRKFFSLPATSPGGTTVNWARVLEQVETIGQDPTFDISLECTGPGYSSILVDSIFISDKVTPETIGNYHLQFDSYTEPETTTTSYQETTQTTETGASSTAGITATGSDALASDTTVSSQATSQGDKTTPSSEATATSKCAVECDLINDFQNNDMCDLVGVFVKTDAIYGFPGDDNSATQHRSKSITECADFCKRDMPGCKSVGYQKLSGRCFFSNTVVTQDDITDGSDSQMADWYNIEGCFTCRVSGCESGTLAPEIPSTTEVPVISHTTTTAQPTQSVCKPTCERIQDLSEHEDWNCGRLYGHVSDGVYTLPGDEEPDWSNHRFDNVAQCAEVCRTLPGCIYTGYQFASHRCFFSNREITEVEQAGDSQSADWNELKCFACSGCGLDESTTSQAPTLQSSPSETPTSLVTTTKAPQTTDACHNNHGEVCEVSSSGVANTPYVCITGGIFSGSSWTEPRSKYPLQESQEQCAAICDSHEDCETSAFWGSENRGIFTSTKITSSDLEEPDPTLDDPSFDPKSAVWSHKSCWTCPTCVPNNSPLPKSPTCNYKQGDSCTRLTTATGVCNASGWLSTGYRAMASEWYPDQSSSAKCAAICRANSRCKGSSYIGGQCYIADDALTPGAVVTRPNINHVWDEPSCWDCPGCHT
ncbi:hypothetical protein FPOA_06414 [Fusarium poae]|uniref:Apple domain-containing protein n=1 Tax=Fusarium poae TaxID=36050 RepID=A0A1B8AZG1_FUSPO|nr:hypothetical protein FPOA_06414 [Fusarium poae]